MELKDLQEFLKDEANQEAFSEIVQAMGFKPEGDYRTIEADRDAERKRKREYQKKLDEMQKRLDDIESKYYVDDEDQDKPSERDPVKKLERQLQKLQSDYEKETQQRSQLQKTLQEKSKQEQLKKTFREFDIDPAHENILISAFAGKAQVEEDQVYIDDKPIADYFGDWVKNEGAHYKRQAENEGARAPRYAGATGKKTQFSREEMRTKEGRKAYLEALKSGEAAINQ